VKNADPSLAAHYRKRANQLFEGMALLSEDMGIYGNGAALLAVHSAISLNDAVLAAAGKRAKAEDHRVAIQLLEKTCSVERKEAAGIGHLRWLIERKSDIAYGQDRVSEKEMLLTVTKARRFATWAYTQFREVLRVEET
jgi:cytosine/adenosine deaminase-related metal-dependent hydrolase